MSSAGISILRGVAMELTYTAFYEAILHDQKTLNTRINIELNPSFESMKDVGSTGSTPMFTSHSQGLMIAQSVNSFHRTPRSKALII